MALEDLSPAVRVEEILDGADIEPATRLEYFMKKAANKVPTPSSGGGVSAITLSNALKSELASELTTSATSAISGSASVYVNSATITNATADDIAAIKSAAISAVNDGTLYSLDYENAVYVLSGYNAGGSPASYGFSVDLGMTEVYGHVLRPTVKIFTNETDVLVSYIIEYQY